MQERERSCDQVCSRERDHVIRCAGERDHVIRCAGERDHVTVMQNRTSDRERSDANIPVHSPRVEFCACFGVPASPGTHLHT